MISPFVWVSLEGVILDQFSILELIAFFGGHEHKNEGGWEGQFSLLLI